MLFVGTLGYGFLLFTGANQTSGVGYATIQAILDGGIVSIPLLAALFVGKLLATTVSLGAGSSGGVFSPSLFLGATLGGAVGQIGLMLLPTAGFAPIEFAVVGMGAMVGGATGASMTAIVMIFEMTRDYDVIVPLVLAVALATGVRRWLITENIYTIKLRKRGRSIPTIRHTNMYLVQQARELMSTDFIVMAREMTLSDAWAALADRPHAHVIVRDGDRIIGYAELGRADCLKEASGRILSDVVAGDFVVAADTNNLNSIIARMNVRGRALAIITRTDRRIPRADDVVGVIDSDQIADAVVRNHYA
jgi:CIC family chloride channel protein